MAVGVRTGVAVGGVVGVGAAVGIGSGVGVTTIVSVRQPVTTTAAASNRKTHNLDSIRIDPPVSKGAPLQIESTLEREWACPGGRPIPIDTSYKECLYRVSLRYNMGNRSGNAHISPNTS